ncbi:MAG: molybdopterin-dependent oxidoreductase, partial [Planctomycetes bacterium]|nr:molybdopterin-dependent oxidoreductase [Planctomycetota bacterium]
MSDTPLLPHLSRRDFLGAAGGLGFSALLAQMLPGLAFGAEGNPLDRRVGRDWEKVYRDLFKVDSTFTFLCAPNDTHNCLLTAYVRNGVMTRIGPTYGYGKATDLDGNRSSARWDPRCCQKGLALTRRFYGDRRVRGPMVRKGFREWVEKGFPRDAATGLPPKEFFQRAQEPFEKVTWEQAADIIARAIDNIARTYSGEEGAKRLKAQHYDEASIEATAGAGVRTLKFRGGMPLIGVTRLLGFYRMANSMALLDSKIRGVGPDKAAGGTGFDNYSWHTDLPPGHPMVTGQQTVEFDLSAVEHSDLVLVWGMNWITTKMPDSHWLTEARSKGTKVVVIACEYGATSSKGDEAIVVRPGTTPALALGLAHVLLREKLFDEEFVKRFTDLPLLVRSDTLEFLKAKEVVPGYVNAPLTRSKVVPDSETLPPPGKQDMQILTQSLRDAFGDFMMWDAVRKAPVPVTRDQVGEHFDALKIDPALEGEFTVTLADGQTIQARPVFDLVKQYVMDSFTPEATEALTWAPAACVETLARDIARARGKTLFAVGMGPNQFFNNDLKDRAIFLLAALTGNVGRVGGNVGSFAGNYRVALLNGFPQWIMENPFDLELDPAKPARAKQYWRAESAHYYNHDDHPLRVGKTLFTGKSHINCPTKTLWVANANSILGNVKWHYHVVTNVLPRMEMIAVNEWWWSATCEWADIVLGVDSWAEFQHPDLTASVTNPFLQTYPRTPFPRLFDTKADIEVLADVGHALAKLTGDTRFDDCWKFVREKRVDVYLQRILDGGTLTKGYKIADLESKAKEGIPALLNNRTYPKAVGYEQTEESKPWYTKSGRLEFYRDEPEFRKHGECLPVHREPVDSTFYEPNAIVSAAHPAVRPDGPEAFGIDPNDLSCEPRQVRNVVRTWRDLVGKTSHPLAKDGFKFIFHTPKYRHGAHTTPVDTDQVAHLFGPFGDIYRRDKRSPFVSEGYVDLNPDDAEELGIEDGDYVWIDSDPEDRPFRGWKENPAMYKVSRLMCRARFYPGTPRRVARMWFNMYGATPGSVLGAEQRKDGLAKSPRTGYQAMFRSGSHQSGTRGWLRPTLMTDTLVRKELAGQKLGKGFLPDVHCPTGAPRESIVKITKAEAGGLGAKGLWRPAALGYRPRDEKAAFRKYQ